MGDPVRAERRLPLRTTTSQPDESDCGCSSTLAPVGNLKWLMDHGLLHVMSPCGCGPEIEPLPTFPTWFEDQVARGLARVPDPPIQSKPPPYPEWAFGGGPFPYAPREDPHGGYDGPDRSGMGNEPNVYVYLSAGPQSGDHADGTYVSCNQDQTGACRLVRLGIHLDRPWVETVQEIEGYTLAEAQAQGCPGGMGVIQPTLEYDGGRLAFIEACVGPNESAKSRRLRIMDVDEDPHRTRFIERTSLGGPFGVTNQDLSPSWPEWLDADRGGLLFTVSGGIDMPETMYELPAPDFDLPFPRVGADSRHHTDELYSNPRSYSNPGYRSGAGDRVVTFGGGEIAAGEYAHMPRVHGLSGEDEEGFNTGDPDFSECHHPAWSPDGTQVACMRQQSQVNGGSDGSRDHPIYAFRYSVYAREWGYPTELFDRPDPTTLDALLGGLLPPFVKGSGSPSCRVRSYKFAQFCGDADHIVVTVFCADSDNFGGEFGIFTSRVVLVNITDPANPVFRDLTEIVERHLTGGGSGQWQGIFATCGSPGGQVP